MGRPSTGAYTTDECKQIELSYLLAKGYIKNGCLITSDITWTNTRTGEITSSIGIITDFTSDEKYIRLIYQTTYRDTGNKTKFDYKIHIQAIPSNLGKGEVLYFICPDTGKRCRILYKAYGCDIWKSKDAYTRRIYYGLQQCSKLDKYNTKYWLLEPKLFSKNRKRVNATYNGVKTKTSIRNEKMWNEFQRMDYLRWSPAAMPKSLHHIYNDIVF